MFLARDLGGLDWNEVDKLRKAISKKQGKEFDAACNLLKTKALAREVPKPAIDEVLHLMGKFGGYAFNRSHACAYAILSYYTAYLRCYYPAEWFAACMHVDGTEEIKMAIYKRECEHAGIKVIKPNVNDSGFETTVAGNNVIALPLTCLKGVGSLAKTIVINQPFDSLRDFIFRSNPNRGLVVALATGGALGCFSEVKRFGNDIEEIMELYDSLVEEKKTHEKKLLKEAKLKYKSLSPMQRAKSEKKELTGPDGVPLKSARMMF
jgi:DNA polymerase-3 subunit alpha